MKPELNFFKNLIFINWYFKQNIFNNFNTFSVKIINGLSVDYKWILGTLKLLLEILLIFSHYLPISVRVNDWFDCIQLIFWNALFSFEFYLFLSPIIVRKFLWVKFFLNTIFRAFLLSFFLFHHLISSFIYSSLKFSLSLNFFQVLKLFSNSFLWLLAIEKFDYFSVWVDVRAPQFPFLWFSEAQVPKW